MPRPRNPENVGLPNRWRFFHGAYYFQVPPGHEAFWEHKKTYRLGKTFNEALETFTEVVARSSAKDISVNLLRESDIVKLATPAMKEGVYFLIRSGKVVYVGRSDNVFSRIATHCTAGKIEFDGTHFVPAQGFEQERLEMIYIAALRPDHNIRHVESAN